MIQFMWMKKIKEDYVKYPGGKTNMSFDVSEGKFLILGDNRNNSDYAIYQKNQYIDGKYIDAKTQVIVYPFNLLYKNLTQICLLRIKY